MNLNPITVGAQAKVIFGICAGMTGTVVAADSIERKITIEPERGTEITVDWGNVEQEAEGIKCR